MKDEIKMNALEFAERIGYKTLEERDQIVYDFTAGANSVIEKIVRMYLYGRIDFDIVLTGAE